ncbi:MAG: protease inhibitor I42 family protein [Methanolobus sp.]|nr:protease inhibitor I42 family protein [Methanolobus sp.]
MKEKKLVLLLLVISLSALFVLISGCTETKSGIYDGVQISDADELWKEGEQLDTDNESDITDEKEIPEKTASGIEPITIMFSENDSGSMVNAIKGDTLIIMLKENPTTGYSWNLSASPGLFLVDDSYKENRENEELAGAGGIHEWIFEVTGEEVQNISAVYMRPWENITGNETSFLLIVNVIPEDKLIKANGTVNYIELEGGFYGITDQNGTHYDPVNLDDEFKKDGLEIEFTAYPRDDLASIHMWGRLIEIRSAKVPNQKENKLA